MISKEILNLLHNAIQEYDKLVGNDYLLACTINKNQGFRYLIFRIRKENFWHLIGCEIDKKFNKTQQQKGIYADIYNKCKNKEDISDYLKYTDKASTCKSKYDVFMKLFNFVDKAKEIKISETKNSPEYYRFKIASGNYRGLIGYDVYKNISKTYFPKTTQDKNIENVGNNTMRIAFILSKPINESSFDNLVYCVSKKLISQFIKQIPNQYDCHYNETN